MDIIEKLKLGICGINVTYEKEDIPEDEGLIATGILDSFGFIELIEFIENEFGIEITPLEFTTDNFRDLTATSEFIRNKLPTSTN